MYSIPNTRGILKNIPRGFEKEQTDIFPVIEG